MQVAAASTSAKQPRHPHLAAGLEVAHLVCTAAGDEHSLALKLLKVPHADLLLLLLCLPSWGNAAPRLCMLLLLLGECHEGMSVRLGQHECLAEHGVVCHQRVIALKQRLAPAAAHGRVQGSANRTSHL